MTLAPPQFTLDRLHDWVLTAQITFEDQRPDIIVPLYMAARLEVQYGD